MLKIFVTFTCIKQTTCLFQPQKLVRRWFCLTRFHCIYFLLLFLFYIFHNCAIVITSINMFVTRATRRMPHVEQELLTLPKHLRSPLLYSGVCVVQSVVFCVISLVFFSFLAIVLSVLLPFTAYLDGPGLIVWWHGSWIYYFLCNQRLSPLTLRVRIPFKRSVLDTTLCDKVCQ